MTNKHMIKYNLFKNSGRDSIIDFIRPFENRADFDSSKCGLMEDLSFELYIFFRMFFNPDLEGFSSLNLH